MKIKLMAAQANERLIWQQRILQYQHLESIEWVSEEVWMGCDKQVWILTTPEDIATLKRYQAEGKLVGPTVLIFSLEWERQLSAEERSRWYAQCLLIGDELLLESEYDVEMFYRRLFKPRRKQEQKLSEPIVAMQGEREQTELLVEKVPSNSDNTSVWSARKFRWGSKIKAGSSGDASLPRFKLCVYGHEALAYELAAVIAAEKGQRVLVIDLDRLTPTADVYLGVSPLLKKPYDFFTKVSATGLNVLLDCSKKGQVQREVFSRCTQPVSGFSNCEVLTGVYQLSDYEYYKAEDVMGLVDKAAGYYDVVILRTNAYLYDGFTMMAMKVSDAILAGLNPAIDQIRGHRQLVALLKDKQQITVDKQCWIMFEDHPLSALESGFLETLSMGTYLGKVPKLAARQKCQATGEPYLKSQYERLAKVYVPILNQLYQKGVSR